jgi:hypothetical protein
MHRIETLKFESFSFVNDVISGIICTSKIFEIIVLTFYHLAFKFLYVKCLAAL